MQKRWERDLPSETKEEEEMMSAAMESQRRPTWARGRAGAGSREVGWRRSSSPTLLK